jgi:hypothetical protein
VDTSWESFLRPVYSGLSEYECNHNYQRDSRVYCRADCQHTRSYSARRVSCTPRVWRADLYRLRGVLLTAMGADETQIEASFGEAIRVAREQKSVSLEKRAESTLADYHKQKACRTGRDAIRLPLCS